VVEASPGGQLTHASDFSAPGLGKTPEAAARAFLKKYRGALGIGPRMALVARHAADPGTAGAVSFERQIDGLPVYDAGIVVGLDATGSVVLVNAAAVPAKVSGSQRTSRSAAIKAARAGIPELAAAQAVAERGWRGVLDTIRPVWRVDFTDWRTYVDGQTGKVLFKVDRRTALPATGPAGPRAPMPMQAAPASTPADVAAPSSAR
jgi:Zn-dependent metalloprotease